MRLMFWHLFSAVPSARQIWGLSEHAVVSSDMTLGYAISLRLESGGGVTSKSYWSGAHKKILSRQILILFSMELKFELSMSVTKLEKMLLWLRKN